MFLHYVTLNENGKQIVAMTYSRERNAHIISQKKGFARKVYLSVRDIPLFRLPIQPSGA